MLTLQNQQLETSSVLLDKRMILTTSMEELLLQLVPSLQPLLTEPPQPLKTLPHVDTTKIQTSTALGLTVMHLFKLFSPLLPTPKFSRT